MYNIILIGTNHKSKGICNISELYKIIKGVNPEVIFEEIAPSYFDNYYKNKTNNNLETDTILKYLENHQIEHIPIDYDNVPPISFFRDDQHMHERIERFSYTYRNLVDTNSFYIGKYGFRYLNSADSLNLNKALDNEIEETLKMFDDKKLFKIRKSWNDLNEIRENEMIKNIYNYSIGHKYNVGLFLFGAAHRGSIINIIQKYIETENIKLNWNYDDYNSIFSIDII
jgi:hypothetical protein